MQVRHVNTQAPSLQHREPARVDRRGSSRRAFERRAGTGCRIADRTVQQQAPGHRARLAVLFAVVSSGSVTEISGFLRYRKNMPNRLAKKQGAVLQKRSSSRWRTISSMCDLYSLTW